MKLLGALAAGSLLLAAVVALPLAFVGALGGGEHGPCLSADEGRHGGGGDGCPSPPVVHNEEGVPLATVRSITVNSGIAGQLSALLARAESDGLLLTGWGYRSHAEQIALREAHCGSGHYNVFKKPASQCRPPTARPGTSMHEQGLAIDFQNCGSRATACWRWLDENAADFGFYNLPSEPWHWSTNGN